MKIFVQFLKRFLILIIVANGFAQYVPGTDPRLFEPGIITTAMHTRDVAMMPDGDELYFSVSAFGYNLIFFSKKTDGQWSEPQPATFITDDQYMFYEPHIEPNGKKLFFLSNKPLEKDGKPNEDIWVVDRKGDSWGEPNNLGEPVNSKGSEFFPSLTRDGTIYFTRQIEGTRENSIYRSRLKNDQYQEPELLGPEVNCGTNRYNAFIDPDERYIIVPAVGLPDSRGGTDYYIVFRDENDQWSQPVNLGDKVNTKSGREYSPYVSPDGTTFFFMSSRTNKDELLKDGKLSFSHLLSSYGKPANGNSDIYWMKADFLLKLKKTN